MIGVKFCTMVPLSPSRLFAFYLGHRTPKGTQVPSPYKPRVRWVYVSSHCFLFSLLVTNQTGFLKLPWGCTVSVTCVWIVKLSCVAGINMSCEGISWLAVWRSGNALASIDQRSCATSDPVSTRMGDRLRAAKPSPYVTSHPGWLSLLLYAGR